MDTIIRPATDDDIDILLRWGKALHDVERTFEPQLTYAEDQARDRYMLALSNPHALLLIAQQNMQPVGYIYAYITDAPDYFATKSKDCVIEVVYLEPDARGKGIAEEFIRGCITWAQAAQAARFVAGIYAGNVASIKLFKKMGFEGYHLTMVRFPKHGDG